MLASAHLYLFIYRKCPKIIVNRHYIEENTVYEGDPDKSLARPVRKEATATKLGIYSTYSP